MNYEQKYKEALARARVINPGTKDYNIVTTIFPELKESEDERIRKEIIHYLDTEITLSNFSGYVATFKEWIAWLEKQYTPTKDDLEALRIAAYEPTKNWSEKLQSLYEKLTHTEQGEQTHTNKEPKFKVGDWVVDGCYDQIYQVGQIVEVKRLDDETYGYTLDDGTYFNGSFEEKFHLWSIQDAKDGDVLEFADHGRIVIGIVSHVNKVTGKVDVNCLLEDNNFKLGNYYALDTIKPHPATKEQRDLLFQKMEEAGYELDADKKELKRIEQNHAYNWNELTWEDIVTLEGIINNVHYEFRNGIGQESFGKEVLERFRETKGDEYMDSYGQKPDWSEEDEIGFGDALWAIGLARTITKDENDMGNLWYAEKWLKSLKDRILPQQKQGE